MPVFVDFLKTSGLWDEFVVDCPLMAVAAALRWAMFATVI
jgi:hypothetical protein